jgi:hypothetical protein
MKGDTAAVELARMTAAEHSPDRHPTVTPQIHQLSGAGPGLHGDISRSSASELASRYAARSPRAESVTSAQRAWPVVKSTRIRSP